MVTKQLILELLTEPSAETYCALLRAVTEEPDFNLHDDQLNEVWKLFETGDFTAVRAQLATVMRLWVHNPEAHVLSHAVSKRLGDQQSAEFEGHFAQCCYYGIQASGDGSFARPYLVARVPDEYALLRHLRKSWTERGSLHREGRVIDAFSCADGTTLHFQLPNADLLTGRMR
jgi:hypothetical protein